MKKKKNRLQKLLKNNLVSHVTCWSFIDYFLLADLVYFYQSLLLKEFVIYLIPLNGMVEKLKNKIF